MQDTPPDPDAALADATKLAQLKRWFAYHAQVWGLQGQGGLILAALCALLWINSGIYKVQPDEQGVVLRFGKFQDTVDPGLHYHWPYPVESVLLPKVTGGGALGQRNHALQ